MGWVGDGNNVDFALASLLFLLTPRGQVRDQYLVESIVFQQLSEYLS